MDNTDFLEFLLTQKDYFDFEKEMADTEARTKVEQDTPALAKAYTETIRYLESYEKGDKSCLKSRFQESYDITPRINEYCDTVHRLNFYIDELKDLERCVANLSHEQQSLLEPLRDYYISQKDGQNLVDKSWFIDKVIECNDKALIITRPRRSGKTLNLQMLEAFFSSEVDGYPTKDLFKYQKIASLQLLGQPTSDPGANTDPHQGNYIVVKFNFGMVNGSGYESLKSGFKSAISKAFSRHKDLLSSLTGLPESEKKRLELYRYPREDRDDDLFRSIRMLVKYLRQASGKKVIILIDEYDTPAMSALESGCFQKFESKVLDPFYSQFEHAEIYKLVIVGVFNYVARGIGTAFNSIRRYTLNASLFSPFFGFTEDEVKILLERHGILKRFEQIRDFYYGFVCGSEENNIRLYNPYEIHYFLDSSRELHSYWTSSGKIVTGPLLKINQHGVVKDALCNLVKEGKLEGVKPQRELDFCRYSPTCLHDIVSLLHMAGYLTRSGPTTLAFPNREIREYFELFFKQVICRKEVDANQSLLHGYFREFADRFLDLLKNIRTNILISKTGIRKKGEKEIILVEYTEVGYRHTLQIAFNALLAKYKMYIEPQRFSRRNDVILMSLEEEAHYIFQPKGRDKSIIKNNKIWTRWRTEKQLEALAEEGLEQIYDKQYYKAFKEGDMFYAIGLGFNGQIQLCLCVEQCERTAESYKVVINRRFFCNTLTVERPLKANETRVKKSRINKD